MEGAWGAGARSRGCRAPSGVCYHNHGDRGTGCRSHHAEAASPSKRPRGSPRPESEDALRDEPSGRRLQGWYPRDLRGAPEHEEVP